jgi:hypothetical protein
MMDGLVTMERDEARGLDKKVFGVCFCHPWQLLCTSHRSVEAQACGNVDHTALAAPGVVHQAWGLKVAQQELGGAFVEEAPQHPECITSLELRAQDQVSVGHKDPLRVQQ